MCNVLEKAAISNPKSARLLAIPFLPYAFFVKAISPFISIYSNIQDIRSIHKQTLDAALDDNKRIFLEAVKRERKISLIKSIGCASISPLYALISAIIFIVQIIMDPLSAARTNHPAHIALLDNFSGGVRAAVKLITNKNEHDHNQLQQELQQLQTENSYIQEHIDSLSIQEMQSIPDPFDRFAAVVAFSTFKTDKRAENRGVHFEEIFKLMEKTAYSSNKTLDALFESAKEVIDSFAEIDNYKPDNVPDEDLCRACTCFKRHITQFFERDRLYSYHIERILHENQSVIHKLLKLYQAEKELKNGSDRDLLTLAVNELEAEIMDFYLNTNLKDPLSSHLTYFKSRQTFLDQFAQYKIKLTSQSNSDTKKLLSRICDSIYKDIKNIDSKYTYMNCNEDIMAGIQPAIEPLQKLFLKYKNPDDQDLITSALLCSMYATQLSIGDIDDYFKKNMLMHIIRKKNYCLFNKITDRSILEKVNLNVATMDDILTDLSDQL